LGHSERGVPFFMQIIAKSEQFTDEQIDSALIKEIKDSLEKELSEQDSRQIIARGEAQAMKGHKTIEGLGKCVAVFPAREFFRLQAKYGNAEIHSKDFLRYFNQKFPDLSPNKA